MMLKRFEICVKKNRVSYNENIFHVLKYKKLITSRVSECHDV